MDKTAEKITNTATDTAQKVGEAAGNIASKIPKPTNVKNNLLNLKPEQLSKKNIR